MNTQEKLELAKRHVKFLADNHGAPKEEVVSALHAVKAFADECLKSLDQGRKDYQSRMAEFAAKRDRLKATIQ